MKLKRRKADNLPVDWKVSDEKKLLNYLKNNSFDATELRKLFPKRTLASLRSKVRKLRINHDLFGSSYRKTKEDFTSSVAQRIRPKIVFDAYAGAGHQTFKWIEHADKVYASELIKSKVKQFDKLAKKNSFIKLKRKQNGWIKYKKSGKSIYLLIGDALDAAVKLNVSGVKITTLDLDTCGSTLPLLPTILLLTRPKNILITHGEFHSMRFKREDVLRRIFVHKDISQNPLPLSVDQMSTELDRAVKLSALRAHNETTDSFWLKLKKEVWLGGRFHGMLRRHYVVSRPAATSDCINEISKQTSKLAKKIKN